MDKEKFLQEFIDFLRGVEDLEFCYESNDSESDQQFNRTYTTDRELITSFMNSHQPKEADLRAKLSVARKRLALAIEDNRRGLGDHDDLDMCSSAVSDAEFNLKTFMEKAK